MTRRLLGTPTGRVFVGVALCAVTLAVLAWDRSIPDGHGQTASNPAAASPGLAFDMAFTTADGDKASTVQVDDGSFEMTADAGNSTTAIRQIAVPDADNPPITSGIWCAVIEGDLEPLAQPGLAFVGEDRAFTLTNNVWDEQRAGWNVHGWVRDDDGTWTATPLLRTSLEGFVGDNWVDPLPPSPLDPPNNPGPPVLYEPPPWSVCLRIDPSGIVGFQAWPTEALDEQPEWASEANFDERNRLVGDDWRYGGDGFDPGEEWRFEGRGGFFGGHLSPGQSLRFTRFDSTEPDGPLLPYLAGYDLE